MFWAKKRIHWATSFGALGERSPVTGVLTVPWLPALSLLNSNLPSILLCFCHLPKKGDENSLQMVHALKWTQKQLWGQGAAACFCLGTRALGASPLGLLPATLFTPSLSPQAGETAERWRRGRSSGLDVQESWIVSNRLLPCCLLYKNKTTSLCLDLGGVDLALLIMYCVSSYLYTLWILRTALKK